MMSGYMRVSNLFEHRELLGTESYKGLLDSQAFSVLAVATVFPQIRQTNFSFTVVKNNFLPIIVILSLHFLFFLFFMFLFCG